MEERSVPTEENICLSRCSDEQFEKNFTLLIQRFAHLSFLSHPFNASTNDLELQVELKNHADLKETLEKQPLGQVDSIYIYGIGLGDSYQLLKPWLEEKEQRDLIYIEDDLKSLSAFLHTNDAHAILTDPHIHVEFISSEDFIEESIQKLSEKYPVVNPICFAMPDYHMAKSKTFEKIQHAIYRKTTLTEASFCDRLNAHQHFDNFLRNVHHLKASFYGNLWKDAFKGKNIPAVICGAGPSIEDSIPQLKKHQDQALILAGGSAITALSKKGITPHLGIAIDPNLDEWHRLKEAKMENMPLLYSTRVHADVFSLVTGPKGYLRSGIGGLPELWLDEEIGLTEPLIGEHLPEESLSVTMIAIAFAHYIGCDPIILAGVDMAYTDGKRYPDGITTVNTTIAEEKKHSSAQDKLFTVEGIGKEKVTTATRWLMERDSISSFASQHPEKTFINATSRGLEIFGIAHRSLEKIFSENNNLPFDLKNFVKTMVEKTPLNPSEEKIIEVLARVKESLFHCLDLSLSILKEIENRKETFKESGRLALFHMDLKEEVAYAFLLYDIENILDRYLARANKREKAPFKIAYEKWSHLKAIVEKYIEVFSKL